MKNNKPYRFISSQKRNLMIDPNDLWNMCSRLNRENKRLLEQNDNLSEENQSLWEAMFRIEALIKQKADAVCAE